MTGATGEWRALGFVVLAAAALRLAGIAYGLPHVFNADEPHHVNVAVSFGAGSLNPGVFKYPTLYMYALFTAFGGYFALWSGLGLRHSVRDFGALFAWHPEGFYLLARLLSAALSLLGLHRVWRSARLLGGEDRSLGIWAAGLLAVSPTLIVSAHAAKPDSMMFFLAAWSWFFAIRFFLDGTLRDMILCGLAAGLAASTQYTAAPLALLPPAALWARRLRQHREAFALPLALGWAAAALGFFGGSPFILLDWPSFWRDFQDQRGLMALGRSAGPAVLANAANFAGPWAGGVALAAGAAWLLLRERAQAVLLLSPCLALIASLSLSPEGHWERYLLAAYPALALCAALGLRWAQSALAGPRTLRAALLAAFLLPGAWISWAFDRELLLPDTRTLAEAWIVGNIPAGTRILADQEHACPRIRMSRKQTQELLDRTRQAGHPRRRYYELLLASHPGGGYEVWRLLREASDLHSGAWHARWSSQGRAVLDASEGLKAARDAGIEVVVLSSAGAQAERSPKLSRFLEETAREGRLLAEFAPLPGERAGPRIRIYDVSEVPR